MEWLLGIGGALLLGVLTNLVYDFAKYGGSRIGSRLPAPRVRRMSLSEAARAHDVRADGLAPLITWSASRPLTPGTLVTSYDGRVVRPHRLDAVGWADEVERQRAAGAAGRTAYVSRLTVDHGEHSAARVCEVSIAESDYAECMATTRLGREDPEAGRLLREALDEGLTSFVATAPPTMMSACVAVRDRAGRLLLLRRSLAVRTFPAQWTVGINETMKYRDEPGAAEDFYALVHRALEEELGLLPADVGPTVITWLGWSEPASCYTLVATVRARLDAAEIDRRREACHSTFEHDMAVWVPFNRRSVSQLVEGGLCPDGSQRWSYLAPLVAWEAWRAAQQERA
ncbi:NUDIX domain-containing protein [Kitasatospora sp. NPDC096140]|uniref:NUDIX domain-containing protein n=1 Tax=Kitasatospora sp. NPDC096140 TaxID=3155425 RepID=UPI00332AF884